MPHTRVDGASAEFVAGRIAALERLPAWWRGRAKVRHEDALETERTHGESTPQSLYSHRLAAEYEAHADYLATGEPS